MSLPVIEEMCKKCTLLEQFFVTIKPGSLDTLASFLIHAKSLRIVHINYLFSRSALTSEGDKSTTSADTDDIVISKAQALSIVRQCSSSLSQFGCNSWVWQVLRKIEVDTSKEGSREGNKFKIRLELAPYESPDVPEQFLVVRT